MGQCAQAHAWCAWTGALQWHCALAVQQDPRGDSWREATGGHSIGGTTFPAYIVQSRDVDCRWVLWVSGWCRRRECPGDPTCMQPAHGVRTGQAGPHGVRTKQAGLLTRHPLRQIGVPGRGPLTEVVHQRSTIYVHKPHTDTTIAHRMHWATRAGPVPRTAAAGCNDDGITVIQPLTHDDGITVIQPLTHACHQHHLATPCIIVQHHT